MSDSSSVLSIDFDSDDLPICEQIFSTTKRLRSESDDSSIVSEESAESDSDQSIELNSVTDLYPQVNGFLSSATCDIDQLVLHEYTVCSVVQDFSCDLFLFEPKIHKHRAFTERAASSTRRTAVGFALNTTDLFLGTLGGYQVIIEKITSL